MDFQTLDALRRRHPAWRLLVADSAPLVASFLHRSFVEPNVRTIARQELVARLDDYLFHLLVALCLWALECERPVFHQANRSAEVTCP